MSVAQLDVALDRPMPQSPDAERAVLGSILINNHAFYRVVGTISTEVVVASRAASGNARADGIRNPRGSDGIAARGAVGSRGRSRVADRGAVTPTCEVDWARKLA